MRLFLVVALCPFFAVAQQTGRVEGRVVSTLDGTPVPKASVRLMGIATNGPNRTSTAYLETTSMDGRFSVEGLPPGSYQATAQRTGYTAAGQPGLQRPLLLNIVAGETTKAEVQLVPLANLSGLITDADGNPVTGATVRLLRYTFQLSRTMLSSVAAINTDDRGQFRLPNVQAGRYYLAVQVAVNTNFAATNEVRGLSAQQADLPTYYPGSPDIRGATVLNVQAANIENLRVRMLRGRTYSIKGTVAGATISTNGPRPSLNLIPRNGETGAPQSFALLRPAGDFEISGVAPGDYTIQARFNDPVTPAKITLGRLDVTITNDNLEGVTVRMAENLELSGKLTIEGVADLNSYFAGLNAARGGPPPNLPGYVPPPRLGSITLTPSDNFGVSPPQIPIQDDGTFRAQNVAPLSYLMALNNMPQGTYVKALRLNGQDLSDSRIDLGSAGSGAALELVLSTKTASLSFTAPPGILLPPVPTPGIGFPLTAQQTITVWPAKPGFSSNAGGVQTTFLPPQGNVSVRNLPPGDYFVAMWEELPSQELVRVPEFLSRLNALAARVTLKEGEAATVEPKVISRDASQKALAEFP